MLKAAEPILRKHIGENWLILEEKSLLRRTWPLSKDESNALGHNASNLTWHQDSNPKQQDREMVVLMTILQDGGGITRPGLSILNTPVEHFEGIYGYEGHRVDTFEQSILQRYGKLQMTSPAINAGDLLIFNGLTFHRTYSNSAMKYHRDGLLVRIIKPEDRGNFPDGNHLLAHPHNINMIQTTL